MLRQDEIRSDRSRVARLSLLILLVHAVCVRGSLLQVQVLHRHGARPHLSKVADDPTVEIGGAHLLPGGVIQLRELGTAIRARYVAENAITRLDGVSTEYDERDAVAYSSDTARTVSSARSFLSGLFPNGDDSLRVPIGVFAAEDRDWVMRSYQLCPAFASNVTKFLAGDTYSAKNAEVVEAGLLAPAAQGIEEQTDLAHAFNTYDRYVLSRGDFIEQDLPPISDESFQAVEEAADWIETNKFGSPDVAGSLVGGPLLSQFLQRSDDRIGTSPNVALGSYRVVEYSGHYPLIMGFLAGLGLSPATFPESSIGRAITSTIPDFGAALVWELHTGSGGVGEVRLFWWNGSPQAGFVQFPCSEDGETMTCSLPAIRQRIENAGAINTTEEFCLRCGEGSETTSFCAKVVASNDQDAASSGGTSSVTIGLVAFGFGLILGVFLYFIYVKWWLPRLEKRRTQRAPIEPVFEA